MDKEGLVEYINDGIRARNEVDVKQVLLIGNKLAEAFSNGNKLILMGNGGSAADAQHIAAEFVGRFEKERSPLPAMALHTNTSSLTAISNDYSYDDVFARQVKAFAKKGDVVVGISTSGNSKNVVNALKTAKEIGCYCVAMTGSKPGKVDAYSESVIKIKSSRTSIIQEVHITIGHIWSKIVEDYVFPGD